MPNDINSILKDINRKLGIAKIGARRPAKDLLDAVLFEDLPKVQKYIDDKRWEQAKEAVQHHWEGNVEIN